MTLEEKIKLEVEMAREEAFKEGTQEEKKIAARKMKADGLDPEVISKYTELPISEIEGL